MSHHAYLRILGYVTTIALHVSNITVMMTSFHGEPMKNAYVRHFSEMQFFFFTCWTFFFQTAYAIFALYTDVLTLKNSDNKSYELPNLLAGARDAFFTIMVYPSTILVFTVFWPFFYYDRSLLFPADIDLVISKTSNHIMHTYILPIAIWEVMFRRRKPPKSHVWHILGVEALALTYFSVLFFVHAVKGVWIYPIFGILKGSILFYLFFLAILAVLPFMYFTQWTLTSLLWEGKKKKVY
ncbi:androgen-dependent TFPI-regulating protein-like [Spodoptera litura]|uniref:Androgen-dependent TFPI-regulating protein-like n=1 Tax=Spodoptera litura TaxID=69820 RepID=A0A9J7IKC0_SPOLT|nr:androgen-dependent TFPI-regulating protein-like [Spodoptera litura]XP_022817153.1 androgen-dependent TFPI-regulating protein-like [Spodoptera litura]XP_022817154.1 androgen-dependent TFPI-regulating protein-like [Spodoptera litura]XP_022817155.1 androgen-dependent TFPI-regulating protein-like [Spodoptera litura]XP_022817156.1 androgen-dependent TFPI-regulating protein-like [Spodoptera litura]XP_022817157.1 androgen-dependent TFPI-regulating protein-like [Spodoptera litura]